MDNTTIDTVSALPGTVTPYDQHVVVCMGHQNWEVKVETGDAFVAALTRALKTAEDVGFVKITACDAPPANAGMYDVLLYPANVKITGLTTADIPTLLDVLRGEIDAPLEVETRRKPVWLVCTHRSRDNRCGELGEQVFSALDEALRAKNLRENVELWHSSHVGQHKFAGNLICYPGGDWYGRVTPADAPALVDAELGAGKRLARLWRGRMGMHPSEQIELFETSPLFE